METRLLPTGTVTLLFTDIEGSTRMLQELGREAYVRALTDHRRLLREAFAAYGGVEVEMQGDSFHFAFPFARDAVAAAVAGQRALEAHVWESEPIRVRMGLHTGEPIQADGFYAGIDVHRAARIMSAAHGTQVVLSQRTAQLVGGELLEEIELLDLGEHRLKDLSAPQRLYQAVVAGLPTGFPPLKTRHVTNLPVQPNRLIGRKSELAEIARRLREGETRLLTLTGPGGTGKTRLALEAAADLVEHFEGGAHFVPLASIRDPALVLPTIATSLGLRERPGVTIGEVLVEDLFARSRLLVLDNFEQVVESAPGVAAVVAAAPAVCVLATSRVPLRVGAEQCFAVPALPVPDESVNDGSAALVENDAVALFVERARGADGRFELTDANAPHVAAVCRLLDGLPLAIELAAARAGVLSPESLVARLDGCLDLLTGGLRDADVRQRTLRATIDWSYDLLGDGERRAFGRLAIFPGGFAVQTAESVCGASLDQLAGLSAQSLLRRESSTDRFRFLRVIREYAYELLLESGDFDGVSRSHATWCLELAREARDGYEGGDAAGWLARAESTHDDFRAALSWSRDAGEYELMLELALALATFWQVHGHLAEASSWFDQVLEHAAELPESRVLDVLHYASSMSSRAGDVDRATPLAERHLELARRLGHDQMISFALAKLARFAQERGDPERARNLLEEAVVTARAAGDDRALMQALNNLGGLDLARGDYDAAEQAFDSALALAHSFGRPDTIATVLFNVGLACVLSRSSRDPTGALLESLHLCHELGDREGMAYALVGFAAVADVEANTRQAAVLLGAADRLLEEAGASLERVEKALYERTESGARAKLGEGFDVAWSEGRNSSVIELIERLAADRPEVATAL